MADFDFKRTGAHESISVHDVETMMETLTDMVPPHLKGKALNLIKAIRQCDEMNLKNRIITLIEATR